MRAMKGDLKYTELFNYPPEIPTDYLSEAKEGDRQIGNAIIKAPLTLINIETWSHLPAMII